jgi:hypothetical protein
MMVALLAGSQMNLSAQERKNENAPKRQRPTQEQLMQMQTNQMVGTLMLDDATRDKFVPLYQSYLKELRETRAADKPAKAQAHVRQQDGQSQDFWEIAAEKNQTDEQIAARIKAQFAQSRKMLDIREKYYAEFSKILSQKQIQKIYQQERSNANKFRWEFDRRNWNQMGRDMRKRGEEMRKQGEEMRKKAGAMRKSTGEIAANARRIADDALSGTDYTYVQSN